MIYLTQKYQMLFSLTSIFSSFRIIPLLPTLIRDIIKSGKTVEMISFLIWEIRHILGLFPRRNYLRFTSQKYLSMDGSYQENLKSTEKFITDFNHSSQNLKIEKIERNLNLCFYNKKCNIYIGAEYSAKNVLLESSDGINFNEIYRFNRDINALYILDNGSCLVNAGNEIYLGRKNDFRRCFTLSSEGSFLRSNDCITTDSNGNIYIGEYGLSWDDKIGWKSIAYLHISRDNGLTWEKCDFFVRQGANKHIHVVKYLKGKKALVVTDGDNHKRMWINFTMKEFNRCAKSSDDDGWYLYNKCHIQKGGHTSAVEYLGRYYFGSDYLGGTNFLLESSDLKYFTSFVIPEPYRRNTITSLNCRNENDSSELWLHIKSLQNFSKSKGLIFYTSDGKNWNRFMEYNGNTQFLSIVSVTETSTPEIYILIRPTDDSSNGLMTLRIRANT